MGDVMYDAILYNAAIAEERSDILARLGLARGAYLLATVHRPYNTDNPQRLWDILLAFADLDLPVVLPVHPRTRRRLADIGLSDPKSQIPNLELIAPVGYLDMLVLEHYAKLILTDSGGVQKEAFFFAVPCLTLRDETEWIETVEAGWNRVVGADRAAIVRAAREFRPVGVPQPFLGDGHSAEQMVALLVKQRPNALSVEPKALG